MKDHCPNINTPEFKKMEAVLGTERSKTIWFENQGQPIWNKPDGTLSPLWVELKSKLGPSKEALAIKIQAYLYTKAYKESVRGNQTEPSADELMRYVDGRIARNDLISLYRQFNLIDKKDPNKPIKWTKTDANYKKVLKIAQEINGGSIASARIIDVAEGNKTYITIALTRKTAFTNEEGEKVAFFDATTGEITFKGKGLTAETVVHEFAHPFVDALATHNSELFNNLLASIRKDSNIPEIKKILDHVEANYKDSSAEIKDKELLAYTLSEYGKGNIDPSTGLNTRDAIKRFYSWLTTLAKELMNQMRAKRTLYVNQIHPKTKYKEVADLFTVYSQLGDINLGSSAIESKKIAPQTITEPVQPQLTALQKRMAAKKAAAADTKIPPAHKMIPSTPVSFVSLTDEAAHMASLLPKEIAVQLTPGYLKVLSGGRKVVGMFENAMISLTEKGPKGTAYHEGFHAVFRTLTSTEEQNKVISEAKAMFPNPTAKDIFDAVLEYNISEEEAVKLFYEEHLADAFAEFMEAPLREEYSSGILGFFQKLGNWITKIFSKPTHVETLFKNISLGKYTKQTPNIVKGVAYKVHPTFNTKEVTTITRELASIAFEQINTIEDLKATRVSLETIADRLATVAIEAEDTGNTELIDQLDLLFDQETGDIDVFWLREIDYYLRNSLGLKAIAQKKIKPELEKVTEEDQDEQNAEDLDKMSFLRSSYEVSGKVNATAAVKFMVAMTNKVTLIDASKPTSITNITEEISPLTGLPVLVDFGLLYNDLENILSDKVAAYKNGQIEDGLENMLTEMKKHSKYKPELLVLVEKLEAASEEIRTQFFSAFSRQKGSFVHHQIKGTAKDGNISSEFTTSNFSTKSVVIRNNWVQAFTKNFSKIEEGKAVYNPEAIQRFFIDRGTLVALTAKDSKEGVINAQTFKKFESVLRTMGVNLSPNTLNYIIESRMDEDIQFGYDAEYAIQFELLVYEFMKATNDLVDKTGSIYGVNNQISDNRTFFQNTLAEAEAYFKKIPGENSFLGPNGNSIYSYQDNDLTSKAVNQFKAGDLNHLNLIKNSAYGKHSVWVSELLDPVNGENNRKEFELQMYGNLKADETAGDKGASASELKPIDAYMDNVNKCLSGYFIGLAEADKARQTYFKGPKFRRSEFTVNKNGEYVMSSKGEGAKILKGYLADELSRMSIAHDVVYGIEGGKPVPEKDWVLYYHFYPKPEGYTGPTIGENNDMIPGNAFNSFLFPSADLTAMGLLAPNGKPISRNDSTFWENPAVDQLIRSSFAKLVDVELKHAYEIGFLEKNKAGEYINKLISSSVINDTKRNYSQGGAVDVTRIMADYVLNSIIGNVEQTKLFNGDPAIYKVKGVGQRTWAKLDHFADFKKRIPAIFASGKDFRIFSTKDGTPVVRSHYTSATIANITVPSAFFGEKDAEGKIGFNKANMEEIQKATGLPMAELEKLFKPYLKINQTDAQAWITLDTYRERLNGLGKWTTAHDKAYAQAVAGENMSPNAVKLLAQPLKTVHAELVPTKNGELIMHYNKQSEAVLLPFMKDLELGELMKAMESVTNPIDHVIVLDGKKAGASGIVDITDGNGKVKPAAEIKMNAVKLSYNNLFLQQDLPSKGIKDTLVGSQGTKNVLSVVKLDGEYFNNRTGQEIVDLFHATIGRLSDLGLISLDNSMDYNAETGEYGFETDPNAPSKVHDIVRREFEDEISENHQEALGENISFDALPIKNKIMNKLMALTTKKTVKLKQQGGALIQLSDLGFIASEQKLTDKVKNGIVWFKNPAERLEPMSIKNGEVKAAQILIPHGKFIDMLSNNTKLLAHLEATFGTSDFKELTPVQIQTLVSKEVLEGMSYRIPNQGPSSNDAFEIVGVLPAEMGDTMVAFSDITTKTGSDFDIDKAFIILPNFYYSNDTNKIEKTKYDINNISGTREQGLQNLRLDLMREMLMHPSAYASVMAPLDEPWLEDFAKDLFPESSDGNALEFFTGRAQLDTKSTFDGAKALVGSIANHMTNHSLALAEKLAFTDYYLGKGVVIDGISSISNKYDEDGKEVSSTLGAYMNAIVDAAKDPFIARANLNHYTAGTTFMLARAGFNREWIASFIGQPIIRDVVKAQDAAEGRFGEPVFSTAQGKYLSAVESVLEQYGLEGVTDLEFKSDSDYPSMRVEKTDPILTNTDTLVSNIKNIDMEDAKYKKEQLKILKQFLEWQNKASQLNDVIKISKADVEGATKTLMTALLAKNLFQKTMIDANITNLPSYFGAVVNEKGEFEFKKGNEGKMIGRYFENAVQGALERFSRFFIAGSKASIQTVKSVATLAGYTDLTTNPQVEQLVYTISNDIYALAATGTRAFKLTGPELHTLLYGKSATEHGGKGKLSIASRVEAAKNTEFGDNALINGLQFSIGRDGAPDKVFLPNTETIKETKEALSQAWDELLGATGNPEIQELAEDLIRYSFYTTGFSKSVGDFSEHIPNSWLKANGFHEDIKSKNTEFIDEYALEGKEDVLFKNLYKNNQLVPVVAKRSIKPITWGAGKGIMVDLSSGFLLTQHDSLNYTIGEGPYGKIFKKFVKRELIERDQFNDSVTKSYELFELVGYTNNNDAVYMRTNTLGVSGYGNNVKEYIGDGKVSVFPKNNVSLPEGLQNLKDMLEQRGTIGAEENYISFEKPQEGAVEDRVAFCIMRS